MSDCIELVDQYAVITRQIKQLEALQKELGEHIKERGIGRHEGTALAATVPSVAGRTMIDWPALAKEAKIKQALIDKHTKKGESTLRLTLGL